MTRHTTYRLAPRRVLHTGDEARIRLPGRKNAVRARFQHADEHGNLTFTDPRTGGSRTVTADAVLSIHRTTKLRGGDQ
ncbi:MAG: hypothetical protein AB7H92_19305 [Microbacteriaceae bacterium]